MGFIADGKAKREQMTKAVESATSIISVGAVLSIVAVAIALYALHVARNASNA